jgi:DNA sulfur modification protein DndB
LHELGGLPLERRMELAVIYWDTVADQFPDWERVRRGELPAAAVRDKFLHSSALVLHALARIGNTLITASPDPST